MLAHLYEWLSLAVRWLHVIAGIAWIGDSFYFMWLDASLQRDDDTPPEVKGESWSVHGGGFYRVIKFQNAPNQMPQTLHWFMWQAYTTWLSGLALLIVVYWLQAKAWMLDAGGVQTVPEAVGIGFAAVFGGFIVYHGLCKSPLGKQPLALGAVLLAFAAGVAYGLGELLSPRAAYIHVGAMIGTWMAGNVAMVIIPNQRKIVASLMKGASPDPALGAESKLRSTHNNYLTLPVIFVMISNHYPSTFGHEHAWLVLVGLFAIGAFTRVFFNMKNAGRFVGWMLPAAGVAYIGLAVVTVPTPLPEVVVEGGVSWADAEPIIAKHCVSCHSIRPTDEIFKQPPNGVTYDTPPQAAAKASLIKQRVVVVPTMPLGNKTGMTDEERALLGAWVDAGAPIPE
jgi:uncharacterized membrane protein